ncbi:IS66 family insertion sequence element accessory protein TnpA [Anaerocolumna sp. AGMB13025]|uniref:IS66 family insertion sequence element accessory protein TnpA n=1 Tax=Anaerocolumna sp. AGMB13025 TaxID=3039116 RepID=UPI003FA48E8C
MTQEVKNHYSSQKWSSIIKECTTSGLPVRQWCQQNGILEGSYYYWLKKIRLKTLETLPIIKTGSAILPASPQDNTVFARLPIPQRNTTTDVTLSVNGIDIGFNNTATAELIHSVLVEIKQLC